MSKSSDRRTAAGKRPDQYLHSRKKRVTASAQHEGWSPKHFRLFVGNLGPDATDSILSAAFSKYASLSKARVVQDRKGENKGYGFVAFGKAEDYLKAFKEMNGKKVEKSAASQNDPTNDAHNQSDPSKTVEHPEPPVPWLASINISNTTQLGILAFVLAYTIIKLGYLLFPIVNTALFTAEVDSSILTQINNAIEKAGSAENVQFSLPEKWPHAVYKQGFNGLCRTNDDSKTVCYYGTNTVKLFMNDIALQIAEYNQIKGSSAFEEKFLNFLGLENGDSSNGVLPVLIAVVIYEVAAILAPLRTFGNPFMGDIALQIADYNKMEDPSAFKVEFLDTLGKVRFEDEEGNASKVTFSDVFNRSDLFITYFFYVLKASSLIELLNLSFCLSHGSYRNLERSSIFSFMNGCAMVSGIVMLHYDWRHLAPFLVSWKTRPHHICFVANILMMFGDKIGAMLPASRNADKKLEASQAVEC
ncbi:hypothetical protein CA3LBN_003085 [Candidozyma haemuli]|uniref:RRM domain-containing protein n=1 Tax=Candidozyma haemuli TaxID=45357 RepID=A0ABX8I6X1_9ASCO|nr:hypothetical protein CA3LBN_003085 [[Candida] haemuloni]